MQRADEVLFALGVSGELLAISLAPLAAALLLVVLIGLCHKEAREPAFLWMLLAVSVPIGFVGLTCGFFTGESRSPAVAALLPAVLTLVGLMVAYLIGRGRLRASVAAVAVVMFAADLMIGSILGAFSRQHFDETQVVTLDQQKAAALAEAILDRWRAGLQLPPVSPAPPPAKPAAGN